MPSRTYQVNYDITGVSVEAVKAFEALKAPMAEISASIKTANENMAVLMEQAKAFKALGKDLVITPKINTKSFADALATMEANVKASSMRMRASLESALSGSRIDHERINNLLGTGNWRKAASEQRTELKRVEDNLKMLKAVRDKYSKGTSAQTIAAKKEADALFSAYGKSGIDVNQRVSDLLKRNGLGNILSKTANGWTMAGGDSRAKLKEFIKGLEGQQTEIKSAVDKAQKKNAEAFGSLRSQTAFNRKGNFVERMLGISTDQLKEIQPTLNAINSLMGGVSSTQDKVQNVVKRTAIPKPLKPSGLPTMKEMQKLKSQIDAEASKSIGVWSRDSELASWRRLEKLGKLDETAGGRKIYETLKKQREIWASSQKSGSKTSEQIARENQYNAYQKQWTDFRQKVADWRKNPYTETTEQITTGVTNAKKTTAQPIKINIGGNFANQIKNLTALSRALMGVPREPVNVPVNVNITSGAIKALETIKTNLSGINTARSKIQKGGFSKLEKIAPASIKEKTAKVPSATTKITVDGSAAVTEFTSVVKTLQEQAGKNIIALKASFDVKNSTSGLKTAIGELKSIASKSPILLKTKLDTVGISRQFTTKIAALRKQVNKSNLTIKAKFDSIGLSGKLRKQIQSLKSIAVKNPITLKAKFDTSTITKDISKVISGIGKASLKNMPAISVKLDITEAKATLNKLLSSIKSASPQTIKLGATTQKISNGKNIPGWGFVEPSKSTNSIRYDNNVKTGNTIANSIASAAAMRASVSRNKPGFVDRLRKSMYPLTGNVSLGASTPVALDMAKGMGIMYGVGGTMNLITGGLTDAMEYQNTMETAEEILKKNYSGKNFGKDFREMSNEVRRVAKQTKFTAPQAADATRFMAMAGLSIPMIKSSVAPIADVAVIGDNDFGEVADKMTNIQTAFQIQPNKMRHVADALTNTFTHTNTDMMMLAESMQYAAPMAHLAGMNLEDTLAMVGIMGNSGIQASMAGTTLRMMMQNTLNPNKKQTALWKKLGVNTRDSGGNLRNMIDILADVKTATDNKKLPMADVVSNLFRVTASAGAGSLIENIGKVKELAAQNRGIGNVSGEISERKQNTVKGMWAQMTSAFTEANLKVFEQFQGDIIGMIKAVKDYFNSKEAVENLKQAFDMIRSLMNMFGTIAKGWMWGYNKFGWLVKAVVWTQMFTAQIGFMAKPIMSLINVFGGLKNMVVGFVSALSGGAAIKNAAITTMAIKGAVRNSAAPVLFDKKYTQAPSFRNVESSGKSPTSYMPYSIYSTRMDKLSRDKMFYEQKGNRLRNSIQKPGSLAREAVNPFIFGNLSSFNPKNVEDRKYLTELMKNRQAASQIYWAHPYQYPAAQRAYKKVGSIGAEMAILRAENNERLANLRENRIPRQMNNLDLLKRFNRMYPGQRDDVSGRLDEYRQFRREQQMTNLALMYRYRYSKFYKPNAIPAAEKFFENRKKTLELASEARRAEQLKNSTLVYRAARRKGLKAVVGASWNSGRSFNRNMLSKTVTALETGSAFASIKSMLSPIRNGFMAVISTLTKGVSILLGPIGVLGAAFAAVGVAAWGIYKLYKKQKEDYAKNIANTNAIKKQAVSLNESYSKNLMKVENGIKLAPTAKIIPLRNAVKQAPFISNVLGNKKTATFGELEKHFSAINNITENMADEQKARTIFDAYIKPNLQFYDTEGGKYAGAILRGNFQKNLEKQTQNEYVDRTVNSGGFVPGAKLPSQNGKLDLSYVKKNAAIAQIYRAGAASKEAMDARKKIYEIYRNAKNLKEAQDNSRSLINELFGANSIQAIGEKDANYSSYSDITKATNLSGFKQYRWGAQNSLLNWINNSNGTKLGYFEGVMRLKEKLTPYTSEWQDAISKILSTMQVTFQDANGKIQQVSMRFSKYGTPLWNTLYDQLKKLHIDFGHSFNDHLSVLAEILKQMWNNPELQQYIKEIGGIREWLMKEAMKLRDIQGGVFKDVMQQAENNSFAGSKGFAGEYSKEEYNKYVKEYRDKNGFYSTPLSYSAWKKNKQDENKSPFLQDIKKRKEIADAVDNKLNNDESLKSMKQLEGIQNGLNNFGNPGSGGSYNSPLADAAKDTNNALGHNRNNGGGVNARPTQINIRVDKLANFDKVQFLKGEEKDMTDALQRAVAEAVSNLVPMMDALVSNDKMVTA